MSLHQHIMLAVDLGNDASRLIDKAVDLARCKKAKLSVVHIDHTASQPYYGLFDINFDRFGEHSESSSAKVLKDLLEKVDYPVEPHAFYADDFATMLTRSVEKYKVDLLVMGHHRYSWLGEAVVSASEPVIRKMPCDILLVSV